MARNGREIGKASFLQEVGREDEVTCAYVLLWEALPSGGYLASCSCPKPVFIETLRACALFRALILLIDTDVSNQYFITNSIICVYFLVSHIHIFLP